MYTARTLGGDKCHVWLCRNDETMTGNIESKSMIFSIPHILEET